VIAWTGVGLILLLTLGITALGIGVGAAYPRFNWENVSQIPAGFGGTIFMVLALSFVVVELVILWNPLYGIMWTILSGRALSSEVWIASGISGLLILLVALLVFLLPMEIGLRRLQEREVW
jgi:ABC-2 type transport system permease protein